MDLNINPALFSLAQRQVWKTANMEKIAVVPADAAMAAGAPGPGAAPPMDPAAMAAGGAAPAMDPAAAAAGGAAPPADPAAMGAPMPGAPMPGAPMPGAPMDPAAAGQQKMKPEQMMQMLDFRLYNLQQQLTAMMNAMDISLPPGALVTPPGSPTPVAEAAVPGGPQDPGGQGQGDGAAAGGGSAISPIEPMQGAAPELAAAGGGEQKIASNQQSLSELMQLDDYNTSRNSLLEAINGEKNAAARVGTPYDVMSQHTPAEGAAALAAMLRQHVANGKHETGNP